MCFRGFYFQEGDVVNMTMDVKEAFRKSLKTLKKWILENLDRNNTHVVLRSYSPVHFRQVITFLIHQNETMVEQVTDIINL